MELEFDFDLDGNVTAVHFAEELEPEYVAEALRQAADVLEDADEDEE